MQLNNSESIRLRKRGLRRNLVVAVLALAGSAQGQWIQHAKLVGMGAVGPAGQGLAVALSADGQTALVGGPYDNRSFGAAWVFTRNGEAWDLQAKLARISHEGTSKKPLLVA